MIRPILAVFAIVAIAVMMGAASVAPAYAAELLVNEVTKNTVSFPFFIPICDTFPVILTMTTTITDKRWDNNKTSLRRITRSKG